MGRCGEDSRMDCPGTSESILPKCTDIQQDKFKIYLSRPLSFLFSLLLFLLSSFPIAPFSICVIQKTSSEKKQFSRYLLYLNNSKAQQYTEIQGTNFSNRKLSACCCVCVYACSVCMCEYLGICQYICVYLYVFAFVYPYCIRIQL